MKPSEALTILSKAGSELSKNSATALACLIAEYEAGKARETKQERAIHALVKDLEAVDKVIQERKKKDADKLKDFLTGAEGV